ncbi:hypothetical protein EHS25_010285 [Saitozyma podzolica]|uniref:ACB domain-containing protein n=1 Tax=Saitozyma podzolica TaxID=1890683 RepID=A0A427YJ59_9TREE|nr:hypothetical protein EHS25_010285 [Saitozyma podzolica]
MSGIDARFNRAVDIVQSLPKAGPVQTGYEEKLLLYSLYKQATEGDISIPRPGLLDMLGRAKWDSWNKQKGKDKDEAKHDYVVALLRILKKFSDRDIARTHIEELEAFTGPIPDRPASPSSSTSSYHDSQASPPSPPSSPPPRTGYSSLPPPDPTLPAPDVATGIIPPSALTASHRSLLNLLESSAGPSEQSPYMTTAAPPPLSALAGSRPHSLAGGRGGSLDGFTARKESSRRQNLPPTPSAIGGPSALGFVPEQSRSVSRPFTPQVLGRDFTTPEINFSPYLQQITPIYPARPGSTSTFSHAPPQPLNIPYTLQQIQTSLAALHERMSTLERTQAMILRRDERRKGWFWTSREEDELDEVEDEAQRPGWAPAATTTRTGVRRRRGLTIRVVWALLTAVRRAMVDVGVGMLVVFAATLIMGGGWRRARGVWGRVRARIQRTLGTI